MDLAAFTKPLVVPDGFSVPRTLVHDRVRAHAITRDDLDDDVAGINASLELIRRTRGGAWPSGPVRAEDNYVDLVWHECEFRDDKSFTYVLTDHDGAYLGCLYFYPMGVRRPLSAELVDHDVDVSWWVTPSAYDAGLYASVADAVRQWLADELPFELPFYSNVELPPA